MRRLVLVAAWVGTTLAVTTAAWAVVSAVDDQVSDRPLTPLVAGTTLASEGSTTSALPPVSDPSAETTLPESKADASGGPTTTVDVTTTTSADSTTTSEASHEPPSTTPTTSPDESSTTTTTVATTTTTVDNEDTSTTTVTTGTGAWETKTINTAGGTMVVSYRPEEVVLDAATANVGWTVRIELAGPPEVRVEFETDDGQTKIDVKVRYKNGVLDVDIKEETES